MMQCRGLARRCVSVAAARQRGYATLIVADHNNKTLDKGTFQTISAAAQLPGCDSIDVLVLGKGCGGVAAEVATASGVSKVLVAESDQLEHPVADVAAELLLSLQKVHGYQVIAGATTSLTKETLPRVAARLDVAAVTDIISVEADDGVFKRPMYAGNAIATVKSNDAIKILTFRPTSFEPAATGDASPVEAVAVEHFASAGIDWVSDSEKASDKPQLSGATRVVSGGRALKSSQAFTDIIEPLCDKLGAAMGASRAAVDAGYVPNEMQVGQTGKVVAPELYIAVGISGAIQHLAGMKDSKTIVAINKDADAAIFQIADYGLVDDLFKAVPEMTEKV